MANYTDLDLLSSVKERLGYPYALIELEDDEIMKIIRKNAIRKFSKYFPYNMILGLTKDSTEEYFDISKHILPEQEVMSVIRIISNGLIGEVASGSTLGQYGLNTYEQMPIDSLQKDIPTFTLSPDKSRIKLDTSVYSYTEITIEVNLTHPYDLSSIPASLIETLETISVGEVSKILYAIRSTYQSINGASGEVNLNLDFLKENIENLKTFEEEIRKASLFSKSVPLIVA